MNKSRAPRCISRFWGHEPFAITVEPGLRVGSLLALHSLDDERWLWRCECGREGAFLVEEGCGAVEIWAEADRVATIGPWWDVGPSPSQQQGV